MQAIVGKTVSYTISTTHPANTVFTVRLMHYEVGAISNSEIASWTMKIPKSGRSSWSTTVNSVVSNSLNPYYLQLEYYCGIVCGTETAYSHFFLINPYSWSGSLGYGYANNPFPEDFSLACADINCKQGGSSSVADLCKMCAADNSWAPEFLSLGFGTSHIQYNAQTTNFEPRCS
jgi:hypothetical protein